MNITKLFVGTTAGAELTHLVSAGSRVTRTRDELCANVAELSAALSGLGVRSRDSVLILGGSRVEIAESILSTCNIGAIATPVNSLLGVNHLRDLITRMRPKCCIFEDVPESSLLQALEDCGSILISIRATAEAAAHGCTPYRELVGGHSARPSFPDHADDHPALVLYGSGSSGALKAVAMSHGALLRFFEYHNFTYSQYSDGPDVLTGSGALVTGLPLTHLAGLATCLQGLMNGRRTFLMSVFLPDMYLKLVEEARCPFVMLVPSLYRSLLKEPYLRHMDRSALRFCITGGEACPLDLLARIEDAFGVPVVTAYSMTECLSGIGHRRHDLFAPRIKPGSCGRQIFGELSLRDPQGHEQPDFGELWVRNPTVHACYLDPRLNEERLAVGWFRTGDLFHRDADGDFFHRGRVDDMFVCNGKNIYPIEMELLLMQHPAVELACAAPVNIPGKGPVPAAMIVARQRVSETEVQEFFMKHGPSHAVPQIVCFAERVPLLGPGKIDRQGVIRLLQQRGTRSS